MEKNRKQTTKTLDDRIRIILEAAPVACSIWNSKFQLIYCNAEAVKLFKAKSPQDYINNYLILSAEHQCDEQTSSKTIIDYLQTAADSGRYDFYWVHRDKTGGKIPCEVSLVRILLDNDIAIVAYMRDLREQKSFLEQVQNANKRTQIMFDNTPISCNIWDSEYNNLDCNQEAVNLFDLKDKKEYLTRFDDLLPKFQPDGSLSSVKIKEKIIEAFEKGHVRFEWMHKKISGELIPTEISLIRVNYGDKPVVLSYTQDLREIKQTLDSLNQLEILASTDSLTGIFNRRYFIEKVREELIIAAKQGSPISIIMFDFDNFKYINDQYGHAIGDEVLKFVVIKVQNILRERDVFARYGGEEFLVLARNTSQSDAVKLAERIRKEVAFSKFLCDDISITITVSCGVVSVHAGEDSALDLIKFADEAMYRAKTHGRNCVEIYEINNPSK